MIGEVSCEGSGTAAATPTVEIENRRRTHVVQVFVLTMLAKMP